MWKNPKHVSLPNIRKPLLWCGLGCILVLFLSSVSWRPDHAFYLYRHHCRINNKTNNKSCRFVSLDLVIFRTTTGRFTRETQNPKNGCIVSIKNTVKNTVRMILILPTSPCCCAAVTLAATPKFWLLSNVWSWLGMVYDGSRDRQTVLT